MPLVEIDDSLIPELTKAGIPLKDRTSDMKALADWQKSYNKMLEGPRRLELLKVIKAEYPDLAIPEIDAAAPVNAEIEAMRKEFTEYREEVAKKEKEREERDREAGAKDTVSKGRRWLREHGCDNEGIEAVETIMRENNLANYEIAFNHFSRNQPTPTTLPSAWNGNSMEWFTPKADDENHKLLLDDPVAFKNAEIAKFFKEKAEGRITG